jgi:predicted NBD/HSP70 family sugar kinase
MNILGLDIAERRAVGVVVDENGAVLRRGRREGSETSAADVVRELASGLSIDAFGVSNEGAAEVPSLTLREVPAPTYGTPGTAAIIAESWVGAARGLQHAVCLKIGERVLAGIMLNGQPWSGAHGLAGSASWLALNPVERQDYRKFGSLAAEVSSKGIARRLSWRIQAGDYSARAISSPSRPRMCSTGHGPATASRSPSSAIPRSTSAWPSRTSRCAWIRRWSS